MKVSELAVHLYLFRPELGGDYTEVFFVFVEQIFYNTN